MAPGATPGSPAARSSSIPTAARAPTAAAFSGKDPSKLDRSGAYAARWVAWTVVAAGLARTCTGQLAYAIGVAEPVSVLVVDTHGTGRAPDAALERAVREPFDLAPALPTVPSRTPIDHWPDVDEDISIRGMLHGVPSYRSAGAE